MNNQSDYIAQSTKEKVSEPLKTGEYILAQYKVMQHMRRGNYYDVYQLWSEERMCGCIGKVLRPECEDNQASELLIQEGRNLEKLTHPNLVKVYEIFIKPRPMVILETLTGQTLHNLIRSNITTPLSFNEIGHLGIQLCSVVQYLHNNNILHLDLNTVNIISQPPFVKVIDLSISRPPGVSKKGQGSKQFMSPEQVKGEHVSSATDVWGIGAVLYNAITGKFPFRHYEDRNKYDQLKDNIIPIQSLRQSPENLAEIVERCLKQDPNFRPKIADINTELYKLV
ncbi:serine/threonine-protein kinase [Peribacillus simplex]|uniref:serine/threonine-protein kinase n=1 Tax=Peribacillus simplex TaxID=1478 RepID=UPI003CF784BE